MPDITAVELTSAEPINPRYKNIIRMARSVSQMEELTENERVEKGILENSKSVFKQITELQKMLDIMQKEMLINVNYRRLARFDEKSSDIKFGHRANPNYDQEGERELVTNEGRGFYIIFTDKENNSSITCFDFDNPNEKDFIIRNKPNLIKAMKSWSPDNNIIVMSAGEQL